MLTPPRTTFANGNNPFAGLYARPDLTIQPEPPVMQKPAKPAAKNAKRLKDEDYTTPYKPPMDAPTLRNSRTVEPAGKVTRPQRHIDNAEMVICNDPLPAGRRLGVGKYDDLFQQLGRGQAIKCAPAAVASVGLALRAWVKMQRVPGVMVRTCKDYGDGLGRAWLLADTDAAAQKA